MTAAFINEQSKGIWVRTTRTAKLLLLFAALVALDSWNRMQMLKHSYNPLPDTLYEFTVKYREPLVESYRKSAQAANTNDVIIRFERKNGGERSTAGYFVLKDVPLLKAYLEDRVPAIVSSNQRSDTDLAPNR
jgi:hypothetical protein